MASRRAATTPAGRASRAASIPGGSSPSSPGESTPCQEAVGEMASGTKPLPTSAALGTIQLASCSSRGNSSRRPPRPRQGAKKTRCLPGGWR
eukprot:11032834-Alexandrium_andersonii.AAC.1